MWLKILFCVTIPSILAWITTLYRPLVWTNEPKGQVLCDGKVCHYVCPIGYFHLPLMPKQSCHPWLTCQDLENDIIKVKVIGTGAVKQVSVATWKDHKIALNEPITKQYLDDYRYGLDMLKRLQGHLEVIQFLGSCNDVYFTQYHKFGSADKLENILDDQRHHNTMATRFNLCLNYVKILNFLHTNKLGTLVMCDSSDLDKTLKQYLITDDLTLVLNDVDSLAKVDHSTGDLIKCGHRQLGGDFVAPEQLWSYDTEFRDEEMPPYDEKSDIWKIPDMCSYFIDRSDAVKIKLDLFSVHSSCKEGQASSRPSAADVLQEYERVYHRNIKMTDT